MAASRRQQVLSAVLERLAGITIANGFNTDAAGAVFLGFEPRMGPDDPAYVIALIVGDDNVRWEQGERVAYALPLELKAIARVNEADPDEAWTIVEAMLQDIKRAIEVQSVEERRFGRLLIDLGITRGPTRTLVREPGSSSVGASLTYLAPMAETWGEP